MAIYRISIIIIICAFSFLSAEYSLSEIYDNVLITYSKIKYYQSDFSQENYWKEIDNHQTSFGKIYYDTENLLMDYQQPPSQFLLVKGDTITIYDSETNQALVSNKQDTELRPERLMADYWHISNKKILFQDESTIKLLLDSNTNDKISVLIENGLITELLIMDQQENFVQYKFSQPVINEDLPLGIFDIKIPSTANFIDMRSD
jgi:outer membrane lipoprotein-sorting protein